MRKIVKREPPEKQETAKPKRVRGARVAPPEVESAQEREQTESQRRLLRSKYLAVINKINDVRDDISNVDSDKFNLIINEVENLHQYVTKPREQVADAEALLGITSTLATSVKSHSTEGISLADFVSCLVKEFGNTSRSLDSIEDSQVSMNWKEVGLAVSPILRMCKGMCTMLGPMNTELKQRKQPTVHRKRAVKPTDTVQPEEVDDTCAEEKKDTDKNMATMFDILRRKRRVKLENLILNRTSFAQTVENLFALSFLVKDGRVEIAVDKTGAHFVSPKNAPDAELISSGKVIYSHFVFRYDYKDWKLMVNAVPAGDELMPHREASSTDASQAESSAYNSQGAMRSTPVRKLSRNRGLTVQDDLIAEDSPENDATSQGIGIRRCKRKLN